MDLQEFWEVNKRWVLGALLGVAVFFVAKGIVESTFLDTSTVVEHRRAMAAAGGEKFGSGAVAAAREEAAQLEEEEVRLKNALAFELQPEFDLAGRGDPGVYWTELDANVRQEIRDALDSQDVDFELRALAWDTPASASEVRQMMLGLNLLKTSFDRLMAAHDRVLDIDPASRGLQVVERLKIETSLAGGSGRRRVRRRPGQASDGLPEGAQEEQLTFRLQTDPRVLTLWLEKCRFESPPIGLRDISVQGGDNPGEPVTVSGTFTAVLFPRPEEDS